MVVSIDVVLEKYAEILGGRMSYSDADRWSWSMMEKFDDGMLEFFPKKDEKIIWQLIQYLYGLDMPNVNDRTRPARNDSDIIAFLRKKNVYELL